MLEGYWFHLWKYVLFSEKNRVKSFMIHSFTQILHLFEIQTWEMRRYHVYYDLEFSAILLIVPQNPWTKMFSWKVPKGYMPVE